ncbi:MAG: PDZ domain-containing protein [Chloroflexi bacterium]|nr:PDZ domain-containing protein [Chloroflexota bacterium]
MKRFLGIGALALTLALIVPAAVLAFSSTQDDGQRSRVSASENDGSADSGDSDPKPWAGLYVMEVTERLAEKLEIDAEDGVAVVKVVEDGPADDAGIEQGDIIVSIGDSNISTVSDVRDAVGAASVGDTLAFTIKRDGSESTYNVTAGEMPAADRGRGFMHRGKSGIMGPSGVGAVIASLNADLAEKLEIETEEGVVIVKVTADGPADDAGLQSGDVIVSIGGNTVETVSNAVTAVRDADVGDTLTFVVDREGESANLSFDVTVEEGYGLRGASLNLRGLGNFRGVLSGDEEGPVDITVSKVTVSAIGEDSVTLTPTEDGNDDITATVTNDSMIFKDGGKAELSDLAVDDEGYAVVIDGDLSVLFIGALDDIGRGHRRFGRFGGDGGDDATTSRRFSRGFGGGALTLPPGFSGGRDFLGPLSGLEGTLERPPQGETTT